ncbi:MAG: pyruvate:ferredoxin (flavodoxin) oxidoreductase [Alcanivoracaceae bacterium]|nr:pyruvate:ferredoxin (flavodoxin) oxidoreductase [Alcanivoracaceae bacterium]
MSSQPVTPSQSMAPIHYKTLDANEAVARVAYQLSQVVAIYPITPASVMGEYADDWASSGHTNLWGSVPDVIEMQSEGGAAGAVHGALTSGALTTTFTASQGLLLMLPDLFKVAGELTSFCMHVAARTVATHALSIFGDHSDVMAARGTGMALLASGSAQEAQDMAAIGHAATLLSRIPFLHFFDGFRTSHEISKVALLDQDALRALVDNDAVQAHHRRALDPDRPMIRGTSQNPDAYFQSREAVEPFYAACPGIVSDVMQRFATLTGRHYQLFDYVGHPQAERVMILMGSGAECAHETVDYLNAQGAKVGILKVRLFRPFSINHLLRALPDTVRAVAVMDRTKEPGSAGEPLLLEVTSALVDAVATGQRTTLPRIIGGRYGLSSKEFNPAMVKAVFEELEEDRPKTRFTVGIRDDVSHSSLAINNDFDIEPDSVTRALFFGLGADGTVSANKASIKIIGEQTDGYAQGHFEYDSRKSGATTISHLRFGPQPIRSTYRIRYAQFIGIHDPQFIQRRDLLASAAIGATVLVNSAVPADQFWDGLPQEFQRQLIERRCKLYLVDGYSVAEQAGLGRRINIVMQACFFSLSKVLPQEQAMAQIRQSIEQSFGRRGEEVVRRNVAALQASLAALSEIKLPDKASSRRSRPPVVPEDAPDFVQRVTRLLIEGQGDALPVSAFPPDGSWPSGTSRYEKRAIAQEIPVWQSDICVQCNFCSMICPHSAIQTKVYDPAELANAPQGFRSVEETFHPELKGLQYTVQVAAEDCTGCGLCIEVCPSRDRTQPSRKALMAAPLTEHREREKASFSFFETIPSAPLNDLPIDKHSAALRIPLFEFSGACAGCGETPYLRLLTQLYGDRLMIANATGCSSIYGGNLPTTPYTTNADGRGPAWSNSLFEDNAEFGLGMRLAVDSQTHEAKRLLQNLHSQLPEKLLQELLSAAGDDNWVAAQRLRITELNKLLAKINTPEAQRMAELTRYLVPRSVWIVGGDGWAYDIGYGGLDHVLASDRKVNVLVLDTEVYSNTGGQQSKATPLGAAAKFAGAGKSIAKKDLGLLAMSYGHVYVAQVAMQARSAQTVKAFQEAEQYPGPSLIIAHSPCIAHGYDLINSPAQQHRAINSGAWPLYRFDPRRIEQGEAPLMLDSGDPKLDISHYMENEARFRMVELRSPQRYAELLSAARHGVQQKRSLYRQLSNIHLPAESTDD